MKSFILLYNGPATPADASHAGWQEWFQGIAERLVDMGSPMFNGFAVHADGTASDTATSLNGYSVVRAEDRAEILALLRDHPFLAGGREYTIDVFEVPRKVSDESISARTQRPRALRSRLSLRIAVCPVRKIDQVSTATTRPTMTMSAIKIEAAGQLRAAMIMKSPFVGPV